MNHQTYLFFFAFLMIVVNAQNYCTDEEGRSAFTITHVSSSSKVHIEKVMDIYKTLLGGVDNGNNSANMTGTIASGYRSIDWDDPIIPFRMARDYLSTTVFKGLLLRSTKNKFRVSNPRSNIFSTGSSLNNQTKNDFSFDSINPEASENFIPFTKDRMFAPIENNTFGVEFAIPGMTRATIRATVQGFGAVFLDVNKAETTKLTYYGKTGCILSEEFVPVSPNGFSFVGGFSGSKTNPIYRVRIVLGDNSIDGAFSSGRNKDFDVVVMDDFIYSEPQPS